MTIVMYRIKDREVANGKKMIDKSILDAHVFHANDHAGRVLFTTPKLSQQSPDQIILALSPTELWIGDIVDKDKMKNRMPSNMSIYNIPSQWENRLWDYEKVENYAWYEIKNLKELDAQQSQNLVTVAYSDDNRNGINFLDAYEHGNVFKSPVTFEWR